MSQNQQRGGLSPGAAQDPDQEGIGNFQVHNFGPSHPSEGYSWSGVIDFLNENQRIAKMKEAEWDLEKQQLQNRAAFLEQELAAQELLNKDLMKRVKMLEYALRQQRINYAKKFEPPVPREMLKSGAGSLKTVEDQSVDQSGRGKSLLQDLFPFNSSVMNNVSLAKISQREAKSRKPLIAKFLEEVGYADIFEMHLKESEEMMQKRAHDQDSKAQSLFPEASSNPE